MCRSYAVAAIEQALVDAGDCGTPTVSWELIDTPANCKAAGIVYAGLNAGPGTLTYLGININGTLYSTSINYATYVGSVVTLIPSSEDVIEYHILTSLIAEGVPCTEIRCSVTSLAVDSGKIDIEIDGILGTEVITLTFDRIFSGSGAGVNEETMLNGSCDPLAETPTPGNCIKVTIAGSSFTLSSITSSYVGGEYDFLVDTTNC